MKKHFSIDQLATATSRQSQTQAAITRRDINKLRDSLAGLHHLGHIPVIHASHKKTKKITTKAPSLLGVNAGGFTNFVFNLAGLSSGGISPSQQAGNLMAQIILGQRVR